ncbi:FAD-binding and (Fe-S)-binding domain-containing protein [Cobetia sp. 10Alg 146]|uniref:FAD-binding and (Fe-S)-binding domain-containing protein n=1 Tax=Cobetia sp. 10Alg 146 TaxID=3040019 RepID=UPI00244C872A|nr:FAD-binding and (Fe-S)-binding domain-containing protein [Cobetia sp. 10Alg 146]MDH2291593.1 FAD-binding and (Fe-S)-binding domain-containing protein [Cobetia sp. 10Alg 146]
MTAPDAIARDALSETPSATERAAAYLALREALALHLPAERLIHDALRTLAYGTDASFYRLVPQLVVRVHDEQELGHVLRECRARKLPVTFRAAGTSLSGQALTDSVLIQLGGEWRGAQVLEQGSRIRLQPGVIGARANQLLAPFGRKIGPDPASINSCMIGGIAANNASGMCCGTAHNSYRTVEDIRVILADGTCLDTAVPKSVQAFRASHAGLLAALERMACDVRADPELAERIRHKYRLKNTTGYSLNALVDYADGLEILKHLMIGSEGTLGFIASITYRTVIEESHKAAALVYYPNIDAACRATMLLKTAPVAAVELMDRAALRSVEDAPGMPEVLRTLPEAAVALLVDVRGAHQQELEARMAEVARVLEGIETCEAWAFTQDAQRYALYWKIRKGLFPAVGAVRDLGTTVIIEDVAFPIERLAEGVGALTEVFQRHGYSQAILFGHALEGNLHFVFPQGFEREGEVERYQALMDDVARLVGQEYGGSLKAEHGTGRNMAPYVELEWGKEAYALMWRIKEAFDPDNLLNPEVILTRNSRLHLENLKPLPAADPLVDRCIECGFCESVCPSKNLSLTPRQRIVIRREIARLAALDIPTEEQRAQLAALKKNYAYQGMETCAGDGLCATQCPVGINTGDLIRGLRHEENAGADHPGKMKVAHWAGEHFTHVTSGMRGVLRLADGLHGVVGTRNMRRLTQAARKVSGDRVQQWTPSMPAAAPRPYLKLLAQPLGRNETPNGHVVYFPSCATRVFGVATDDIDPRSATEMALALMDKAGFEVVLPKGVDALCCGMAFQSKGQFEAGDTKAAELAAALVEASDGGRLPIFCDTSPCLAQAQAYAREHLEVSLTLVEPVQLVLDYLLPHLSITPLKARVAVHVTCSSVRMGLAERFVALARQCATEIVVPEEITCCGFAGDKGFATPELNASALKGLKDVVADCDYGVSNSRTCEIGLSEHSGLSYQSILGLVERASASRQG